MVLHFKVADLLREITALRSIAGAFLAADGEGVLQQVESDLKNLAKGTTASSWSIHPEYPLETRLSNGNFQRKGKGELDVIASVSFVWDLEPVRGPKDKTKKAASTVALIGRASTVIRVVEVSDGGKKELAMWRMEVADEASPGTHFHVQVLGTETHAPFPKSLDVPRLPSVLVSPFACVEFAISELFQDDWARTANEETSPMSLWRGIQARRSTSQLMWHQKVIDSSSGSPWNAVKRERPPFDLFL